MPVDFAATGIGWRQSADGKIVFFTANSKEMNLGVAKWSSPTAWAATYMTFELKGWRGLLWLRITDDNTNRKCWLSVDKYHWVEIHSVGRTDYITADQVCFIVNAGQATYDNTATLVSWEIA
jgi:hypothetical protein